jgi:hypothetical protein
MLVVFVINLKAALSTLPICFAFFKIHIISVTVQTFSTAQYVLGAILSCPMILKIFIRFSADIILFS